MCSFSRTSIILPLLILGAGLLQATGIAAPQVLVAPLSTPVPLPATVSVVYTNLVLAMRKEPSPTDVTYSETFTPLGLGIRIVADGRGGSVAQLVFSSNPEPETFRITQTRSADLPNVYDVTTGEHFSGAKIFWAATWSKVHPAVNSANVAVGEQPETSRVVGAREQLIADVVAMSDRFYRISGGEAASVNGVAAYHLHLVAREDKVAHPLTDLYVDRKSFLVLRAIASFRNEALIGGDSGTITLDFGRMGTFWMVTSGEVTARAHALLAHAVGSATFAVSDVIFLP